MATETVQLADLAHFHLAGPDAERYLNGQVSQQIAGMSLEETRYTFVCDPKGRILFDAHITRTEDGFLLNTTLAKRELVLERLDKYLISDDCEWNDETEKWTLIHQFNPEAEPRENALNRFGFPGEDRYYPIGEIEFPPVTKDLSAMETLRIAKGVPHTQDLEGVFPAETRIENRAVSFAKGCYLGQEVVSRMKRAGRTNRQLTRALFSGEVDELPAEFTLPDGEKALFTMTSLAHSEDADKPRPALGYVSKKYDFATPLTTPGGGRVQVESSEGDFLPALT
jgi:folate-binding protein YgfZ